MSSSPYKNAAARLLKCFCGCQDMTVQEVQRIYQLNAQSTLIDRQAVQLFKSFLKQSQWGDDCLAAQYLAVYEQCDEYMKPHFSIVTLDELEELVDLGLPRNLEKELHGQIQTGDSDNITRCLLRIQGTLRNEIELSAEYEGFKNAILRKLQS